MIAIVGAGLQGACLALELAAHGQPVTLIDAAPAPMQEASRWNEGKLHLGFVYANDPSLRTAEAMFRGSTAFLPCLERLLGRDLSHLVARDSFVYGVPQDSLLSATEVARHFEAVGARLDAYRSDWPRIFGGRDFLLPTRISNDGLFAAGSMQAAFATPEVAIDTHGLADLIAARLREEPLVRLIDSTEVISVARQGPGFRIDFAEGASETGFRCVVNASWRSLMRIDSTIGCHPGRNWLYRYKTAIHLRGDASALPSCTFIVGPYGDIVNFGDGRLYLSWYPVCRLALSNDVMLPDVGALDGAQKTRLVSRTLERLAGFVPGIEDIALSSDPEVEGGWIFAWGETDITDRSSGLHRRHDVGAFVSDGYVSLNTGKYCMAPLNARRLANELLEVRALAS